MTSKTVLSANDFRSSNELFLLVGSFLITAILTLVIMGVNPLIPIVIIIFSIMSIKIRQKQLFGNTIRVSEKNFPEIHKASIISAKRLSMKAPDVFVTQSPFLNAYAMGFWGKKSVIIHTELIKVLTQEELIFIIGHELSHIKCGHTSWLVITNSSNTISIPFISPFLNFLFLFWSRSAEYTSDRGGLIACRSLKDSTSALMKLATGGLDPHSEFVNPESLLETDDGVATRFAEMLLTHPYLANRVKKIADFSRSKTYEDISGNNISREDDTIRLFADQATRFLKSGIKSPDAIKIKVKEIACILTNRTTKGKKTPTPEKQNKRNDNPTKKPTVISVPSTKSQQDSKIKSRQDSKIGSPKNNNSNKFVCDKNLYKAVIKENVEAVSTLLNNKTANPNFCDKDGDTLLHLAVQFKNIEIIKVLLKNGAVIDSRNAKGETPLTISEGKNDTNITSILKKYSKYYFTK